MRLLLLLSGMATRTAATFGTTFVTRTGCVDVSRAGRAVGGYTGSRAILALTTTTALALTGGSAFRASLTSGYLSFVVFAVGFRLLSCVVRVVCTVSTVRFRRVSRLCGFPFVHRMHRRRSGRSCTGCTG